ncbi:MAG: UvrD-helicase domain-containing protein, partial [Trueperaceae bacterium]|nr:UvrD-helicase domain-containing protein [Trueperaceae bacterium]
MAAGARPRWWHAPGPWVVKVEGPPPPRPRSPLDAWALLLGAEPTVPIGDAASPPGDRAGPPPRAAQRRAVTPTIEGALAWARDALEVRAAEAGGASAASSVAFRVRGDPRVRWRAHTVRDVRDAARAVAGWEGAEPAAAAVAPAAARTPASTSAPSGPSVEVTAAEGPPTLTAAQRAVVAHDGARAVVLAVAGAGKTTTMVARVRHRVATGRCDPAATLVVSFSRAAVAAVRAKLDADPTTAAVSVLTFHALAHRLLA